MPRVGLGEDEEGVAHRRRAEPLVAGRSRTRRRARRRSAASRDGRVGAHVGAALLLGHRHPAERAALVARPAASARRSRARGSAAPTRRPARAACAAPGSPSRSSRSGSRRRLSACDQQHERRRRGRRGRRAAARARARRAGRARPPIRISSCQEGWNSTSSMRLPKRSWVRSFGGVLVGLEAPADRLVASRRSRRARGDRAPRPTRRPRAAAPRPAAGRPRTSCSPPAGWAG